jgi:hypothetical protein
MKTRLATGLVLILAVAAGLTRGMEAQERARTEASIQAISWDSWLTAKAKAEENDAAGNLVAALQYYLEYIRQAQGLNSLVRVAWGKNNAAYMIIKMHRQDPTVDLVPAEKLLEEGLAIPEATEDCRRVLSTNLEHVKLSLGRTQ